MVWYGILTSLHSLFLTVFECFIQNKNKKISGLNGEREGNVKYTKERKKRDVYENEEEEEERRMFWLNENVILSFN